MIKKIILLLNLISICSAISIGQYKNNYIGTPQPMILTTRTMDANQIRAYFTNDGTFNFNTQNFTAGFEWPLGTGSTARFASGIWIGAIVGHDTLVSVGYYSGGFLPGYTDDNGIPHGKDDPLYTIYKLTFGVNNRDRQFWPNSLLGNSDQGAPVYFDSVSNSWMPLDYGYQTMYYVYTDTYRELHPDSYPLKADVKQLNFAFNLNGPMGSMMFTYFIIINRNSVPWNNTYITIWTDDDIGYYGDDKVGVDSTRRLGYTYNADNNDPIYGANPPAVGFDMLRGAVVYTGNNRDTIFICEGGRKRIKIGYKDLGLTVFNTFVNDGTCSGDPRNYRELYHIMQVLDRCGQPRINPIGNFPTKFIYSGDPGSNTGWIQPGSGNDVRFTMSSGPVNVNPNDTQIVVVAQLIARGSSNLNSIVMLRWYADLLKRIYGGCFVDPLSGTENSNSSIRDFRLYQNFPNPFNPITKIKFDIPGAVPPLSERTPTEKEDRGMIVSLLIYDALGRQLAVLVNERLAPGTHEIEWNASNFPSGVYYYRLTAGKYAESKKMLLIK